jgi:hypothetical protein
MVRLNISMFLEHVDIVARKRNSGELFVIGLKKDGSDLDAAIV